MVPVDLAALARASVEQAWPGAHERGFDLGIEAPDSPVMFHGNALLLREMLANLIDNALKYSPRHGAVTVRLTRPEGALVLEVEDAGIGIAEAERTLVFERFYRGEGASPDQEGTGIGLAIVKEIVTQHGGSVRAATPASGTGTLMRVTLPRNGKT
jgi:two-component system sensor histidine kinase TctE